MSSTSSEISAAEVKYWLTINEPTDYVMQGYINGEWPPFLNRLGSKRRSFLETLPGLMSAPIERCIETGPTLWSALPTTPSIIPCNTGRRSDRLAAKLRDFVWNGAFLHLIGTRRRNSRQKTGNLDFIGLNYYKRTIVHSSGWGLGAVLGRTCELPHHHDQGPLSEIGWEVYPRGLKTVLEKFSRFGLPLLVTENGIATDDESLRCEFVLNI